jgi:hypothetical protein
MDNCQWILAEHNDTYTPDGQPRPHLHAVINRIPIDSNKAVNSSFIKWRVEEKLQQLRDEYDLTPIEASWQVKRKAPSTGQVRQYRQELEQYQSGKRTEPPELPIKVQLQNTIDKTAQTCTNLPQLVEQLSHQGIDLEICYNPGVSPDSPKVIVYHWDEQYHFRASQLGRAYTLSGLQQFYNIDRDIQSDKTTLSESNLSLKNLSEEPQKKSQSEL